MKEAIQWARLDHPNILPFYGVHYLSGDPDQFAIVTPWRESGTLTEYLERNPFIRRENLVSVYMCDLGPILKPFRSTTSLVVLNICMMKILSMVDLKWYCTVFFLAQCMH